MSGPLTIKKFVISPAALQGLSQEQRGALLLLGHLLNEANWLRKLLVQSVMAISDTPEGQAQFALVVTLATTLGSKLYEGWLSLNSKPIGPQIKALQLPQQLIDLRKQLHPRFDGNSLVADIRNRFGFHYPSNLDFSRLPMPDGAETSLFFSEHGYRGDVFMNIAALAAVDALIAHRPSSDWQNSLREIWEEITDLTGGYCCYISELIAFMITQWLPQMYTVTDEVLPDAPTIEAPLSPMVFFAHPPGFIKDEQDQQSLKNLRGG